MSKLDESIEHLWVVIQGKKKKSARLIGLFYQPSFENNKKIELIEKLDSVLSIVKFMWNGVIMITGDNNIETEIRKPKKKPKSKKDSWKYLKLMI